LHLAAGAGAWHGTHTEKVLMTEEKTTKSPRTCPSCGATTEQRFCPHDGTATVEGRALYADPTALRPGDVVNGRYRITELIGRGGFGAVYAGEHTGTHQQVALKLLMPSDDDAKTDIRRFHQEAQLTASLRHPNTVRVFDIGQTQHGALYLAMELLHGQTLEERLQDLEIREQPLPQAETLDLGIQTLKALSEAHGKGLVHRDLKPANLMLTELEGERLIKVLDFGIARREGSTLTGEGRALGTPAYMSPEQCMGDDVDGRADIYALGCILFRCLTGRTPFEAETAFATMQGHALAPIPDLSKAARLPVAPGLKAAIEKMLAKSPKDRFQSARELRTTLELLRSSLVPDDEAPTMAWTASPQLQTKPAAKQQDGPLTIVQAPPSEPETKVTKPLPQAKRAQASLPGPAPKPLLTVTPSRKPKKSAQAATPGMDEAAEYAPLPQRGMPGWLPWAIGAAIAAAVLASFLAWR
jgi:serine/threonine protein kinase